MQFHLDGYTPGDPNIRAAASEAADRPEGFPDPMRRFGHIAGAAR